MFVLKLIVQGKVQGVSFRAHTQKFAFQLGIKGWVKNLKNGDVEIYAEGETTQLRQLLQWAKIGPALAKVDKISEEWLTIPHKYDKFQILNES